MRKIYSKFSTLFSLILFLSVIFSLFSCGSAKDIVYLQPDSTVLNSVYEQHIPTIQRNDLLTISVSAADMKSTLPFNQQNPYAINGANSTDLALKPTYNVDENGDIEFPVLGKIRLLGLTKLQAIDVLKKKLAEYLINPGVNLSFNNYKITVLGEVAKPGSYTFPTERVTIFDALGMAGDLTIKGIRKNVTLVREVDGVKTLKHIDLTKQALLNSPDYYLRQNDVLYVEPNLSQVRNSNFGQNTNVIISVAALLVTVISVIVR